MDGTESLQMNVRKMDHMITSYHMCKENGGRRTLLDLLEYYEGFQTVTY